MNRLTLDTNVLIGFLQKPERYADAFAEFDEIVLCPVVLGEFRAGLFDTKTGRANRKALEEFLKNPAVKVWPVRDVTSVYYAQVFQTLRKTGCPIPVNDIWISAFAIENGLTLATEDGHFSHVPMLRVIGRDDMTLSEED